VRRVKKIGNAHIFEAVVTRKAAHGRLIDELLHVFGGSPRLLMAQLVETGRLTLDDVREVENTLATLSTQNAEETVNEMKPAKRRGRSAK
jgi:predicted transcriptional regulator